MFSFSFTTDVAPVESNMEIDVANPVLNQTVNATVLVPDLVYTNGFE